MVERLGRLDASFLYLEEPGIPMHVGGVLILDAPPGGLEALAALVEARLSLVPRYRQRVAQVPGHLANPVWVDDPEFDISYHLRRSGLPRPGTERQLLDLVSRLTARPLDRNRPLWEAYLVEGLPDGRVAVVTKTHPALVDGLSAIDIGQVLLDVEPDAAGAGPGRVDPAAAPDRHRTRLGGARRVRPPAVVGDRDRPRCGDRRPVHRRPGHGDRRGTAPDRAPGGAARAAQPAERPRRTAAAGGGGAGRAG